MIGRVAVVGVLAATLVGCRSETEADPLGIGLIGSAVEAVRAETGTEPRFFEIDSTAEGVTLFVLTPDESTEGPDVRQARFTAENGLVLSDAVMTASGPTFDLVGWASSPEDLTEEVFAELPRSRPLMFVMTASADEATSATGGIVLRVLVESEMGGRLAVFIDRDGRILGTDVLE